MEFLKKQWNLLSETTAWILSLVAGFLRAPPGDTQIGSFGQFFLTLVIGLMLIPAHRYRDPQHTRWWVLAALVFLVLIPAAYFGHVRLFGLWTCEYSGQQVVVGSDDDLTDIAKAHRDKLQQEGLGVDCKRLLWDFAGDVGKVWHRDAVERRRWVLGVLYVLMLPLFAGGVICVIQAFYCGTNPPPSTT